MSRILRTGRRSSRRSQVYNAKSIYLDGITDHIDLVGNYYDPSSNLISLFYDNACTLHHNHKGYRPQWWNIWVKFPAATLQKVVASSLLGEDMKYMIMTTGTAKFNIWGGQHLGLVSDASGNVTVAAGWGLDDETAYTGRVLNKASDYIVADRWYMITVTFRGRDGDSTTPKPANIDLRINNKLQTETAYFPSGISTGDYKFSAEWTRGYPAPHERADQDDDFSFIGRKGTTYTEMYIADLSVWDDCKPNGQALANLYNNDGTRSPMPHAYTSGYQTTPLVRNYFQNVNYGGNYGQITQYGKRNGSMIFKFPNNADNGLGPAWDTTKYEEWWFKFTYADGLSDSFEFRSKDDNPAMVTAVNDIMNGTNGYTYGDFTPLRLASGNWPILVGGSNANCMNGAGSPASELHEMMSYYFSSTATTPSLNMTGLLPSMPNYQYTSSQYSNSFYSYNTQHPINGNDVNVDNPTGKGGSYHFTNIASANISGFQDTNTLIEYASVGGARHYFGSGSYYGQTPGMGADKGSNAPVSFSRGTQLLAGHYKFHGPKHYGELFPSRSDSSDFNFNADGIHYPGLQYIDKTIGTTQELRKYSENDTANNLSGTTFKITCFDIINHGGTWNSDFPPSSASKF